ncbi:MAG: hypothetical protein JO107_09470 [Hyphomicrobiales bacterium]|nr:hypothetical protein [Hyphomicrobiales bacterium]MBV8663317.1 hypothetical protein [Hyphomicrobiales bacterium]
MAGTLNIALTQQFDIDGNPLAGALLYFYQAGTVATPQNAYQDFGLTLPLPNPLATDQFGRIPMFYLADGQIHVRLTDSTGVVIFDYATMQVIGPSSGGGGGGGGGVDPTTIAATGDFKWRPTSETLSGWVKANSTTIGSATSGASQRANADTQNLFVYLWSNFSNAHCPVSGGRGATALADFQANKTIGLPDLRAKVPAGLDDMGTTAAGIIQGSNVTSGNGDGPTTPGASGGEANHTLTTNEAPQGLHSLSDPGHSHTPPSGGAFLIGNAGFNPGFAGANLYAPTEEVGNTSQNSTNISLTDHAGGGAHNTMQPFTLGTYYIKL